MERRSPWTPERVKLAVFDVEGVLIPKARFLLFEVFMGFGVRSFVRALFYGFLYFVGLRSLKESLKKMYGLLSGLSYERFIHMFQEVSLMPDADRVFEELRKDGFKIALISSGIPRIALQDLAKRLGADFVSGVELGVSEGRLTGEAWGEVIEDGGKALALKELVKDSGMSHIYCVSISDDGNNVPLFPLCDLNIGYNPDYIVSRRADYAVKGDLSEILPLMRGEQTHRGRGPTVDSLLREAIHIGGFAVPIVSEHLVDRHLIAALILIVAALYLTSETLRMLGKRVPVISDITRMAAGRSEFQEFVTSPVFYAIGITLALLAFPGPIAGASIAVLTLGDGFASILGRRYGRRRIPFNKNKAIEGTMGGLFFAFLGALIFVDPFKALVASAVGMLVEVVPLPLNDNLTIPLASGLSLMALTLL
jgi:dolichol kinase/phosphoserine phosphatase